jgi:excisionase family DNA binding protein
MGTQESEDSETEIDRGQKTAEAGSALERWRGRFKPVATSSQQRRSADRNPRPERPRTVNEAAEELGLSVHTIRAWIACRRLSHLRLGRAIRIPAAEIRRVIEESTVPAIKEE